MPTITQIEARRMGIPHKTIQTILFNKNQFNVQTAKKWLKEHNYVNSYYRTTTNEIRFMQTFPIKKAKYYSKKLPDDVILVFQEY